MPETVPPPTKPDVEPKPSEPKRAPKPSPFEPDWPADRPLPQPKGNVKAKRIGQSHGDLSALKVRVTDKIASRFNSAFAETRNFVHYWRLECSIPKNR